MANYYGGFGDLTASPFWPWTVTSESPLGVNLASQGRPFWYMELRGSLTVSASGAVSGTVTSLDVHGPEYGTEVYHFDNLSADAATLLDLILHSGQQQMFEYLLGGDDTIYDGADLDIITGFAGNDTIKAGDYRQTIIGDPGNDTIDGGGGIDTVRYAGAFSDYKIAVTPNGVTVTDLKGETGTDTLINIENIRFADKTVTPVNPDGVGGEVFRLYHAAFDRDPDLAGMDYWLALQGSSHWTGPESGVVQVALDPVAIADGLMQSDEYRKIYDGLDSAALVSKWYQDILHHAPDQADVDFWAAKLDSQAASKAQVLAAISESQENYAATLPMIGNGYLEQHPVKMLTLLRPDFDMSANPAWEWAEWRPYAASNQVFLASTGNGSMWLYGDFTVDADKDVHGTVTGLFWGYGPGDMQQLRFDNLSVDVGTVLDVLMKGPGPQQLFEALLGGDETILGTAGADTLTGFGGNDTIKAGDGDDTILADAGDDAIDGGRGVDTVKYSGLLADYKVEHTQDGLVVTSLKGDTGTDTLSSIEKIVFADKQLLPVDVNGPTGEIFRLYHAAFGRMPDAAGLEYWTAQVEKGLTLDTIADSFVASGEYKDTYGAGISNTDLVTRFYEHILGRAPEKAGLDYWVGILDSHAASVPFVLATISESPEHVQVSVPLIGNGVVTDIPIMT